MSQIIKAFTGIFMILFMMTTATGLLGVFLQITHAQNLHASVIQELENSNYAATVLEECFDICQNWGYELELILYKAEGGSVQCESKDDVAQISSDISSARICLVFPIEIVFWDVDMKQQLFGYGR